MFSLHPQLFQVERHNQQEQLGADICLAPGEKPAKTKVAFEQGKGAFHLDGTAQAQMDAAFGNNPLRCLFPLLPKGLLQA